MSRDRALPVGKNVCYTTIISSHWTRNVSISNFLSHLIRKNSAVLSLGVPVKEITSALANGIKAGISKHLRSNSWTDALFYLVALASTTSLKHATGYWDVISGAGCQYSQSAYISDSVRRGWRICTDGWSSRLKVSNRLCNPRRAWPYGHPVSFEQPNPKNALEKGGYCTRSKRCYNLPFTYFTHRGLMLNFSQTQAKNILHTKSPFHARFCAVHTALSLGETSSWHF